MDEDRDMICDCLPHAILTEDVTHLATTLHSNGNSSPVVVVRQGLTVANVFPFSFSPVLNIL